MMTMLDSGLGSSARIPTPMAGHSKWANIQHRKKAQDARRGKLFTKLIREVTIAAREGGGDADGNSRLRLAMEKAFAGNVPKDTVDRAIKRATGEGGRRQPWRRCATRATARAAPR